MRGGQLGKRGFDVVLSILLLLLLWPLMVLLLLGAALDTKSNGMFTQKRVGQYGRLFDIYKIRSYHSEKHTVSKFGKFLRTSKLDELPQLFNVLLGSMSFVGPRPDIPGYYDQLTGEDRLVLNLKPGITSAASIKYKNEDALLEQQDNPDLFNDEVLFPDKVKMNLDYYYKQSFWLDLKVLYDTIF